MIPSNKEFLYSYTCLYILKEFWIFYNYVYMQCERMKEFIITGLGANRKSVSWEADFKLKGAC